MQQKAIDARGMHAVAGCAVAAVLAAVLMAPLPAYADPTSAEKQAEAQVALNSLNAMQATLDEASDNYFVALDEQAKAESDRDAAQVRIGEINTELADLQQRLGLRASSMYRSGSTSFLDILLGSTSFTEFATNWDLLNSINESDAQMVQQTKDLRAEAEEQEAVLAEQARIASEKADEAKRIQDEASSVVASMQATYDSLSAEAAELLEQERAAQAAAEAAAAQAVVDAAIEQANTPSNNTPNTPNYDTPSTPSNNNTPSYDSVSGSTVLERAYNYIGNADYVWGACSPGRFDCSGFVSYCLTGQYARLGTTYTFLGWGAVPDPQPGDVAVNEGHCGIYIGGGQMIHCASPGQGVIIGPVQSGMVFVRY